MKTIKQSVMALTLAAIPLLSLAAVPESEADKLGGSLTPMAAFRFPSLSPVLKQSGIT